MSHSNRVSVLGIAACAALLAGCAAAGTGAVGGDRSDSGAAHRSAGLDLSRPLSVTRPMPVEGRAPEWMRFGHAPRGSVYVSQFNATAVNDYARVNRKNAPPLCQVTGQPYVNGIGVDASRNLWVPVGGEFTGVVNEFAPHCGKLLFSIQVGDGQPAAIAFDAAANVYVLNIFDANANGNVEVYAPGATQPTTVLSDTTSFRFFDEAIDASTNVYVAWADVYNKGHLDEFPGGANPVTHLPFQFGFPGGVALDARGNLLVVDDDALVVDVLAPPYTGNPIATFHIKGASIPCRFTRPGRELYCSDYQHNSVDVYSYSAAQPGATRYLYSFNNGIGRNSANGGLALSPG